MLTIIVFILSLHDSIKSPRTPPGCFCPYRVLSNLKKTKKSIYILISVGLYLRVGQIHFCGLNKNLHLLIKQQAQILQNDPCDTSVKGPLIECKSSGERPVHKVRWTSYCTVYAGSLDSSWQPFKQWMLGNVPQRINNNSKDQSFYI